MMRFLVSLLCALAIASMGIGATAHAAEGPVCIEELSIDAQAHASDSAPDGSQPDKNVPHQHGSCHGHYFAAIGGDAAVEEHPLTRTVPLASRPIALAAIVIEAAPRPPQA